MPTGGKPPPELPQGGGGTSEARGLGLRGSMRFREDAGNFIKTRSHAERTDTLIYNPEYIHAFRVALYRNVLLPPWGGWEGASADAYSPSVRNIMSVAPALDATYLWAMAPRS